jgi:hypothetical protein
MDVITSCAPVLLVIIIMGYALVNINNRLP